MITQTGRSKLLFDELRYRSVTNRLDYIRRTTHLLTSVSWEAPEHNMEPTEPEWSEEPITNTLTGVTDGVTYLPVIRGPHQYSYYDVSCTPLPPPVTLALWAFVSVAAMPDGSTTKCCVQGQSTISLRGVRRAYDHWRKVTRSDVFWNHETGSSVVCCAKMIGYHGIARRPPAESSSLRRIWRNSTKRQILKICCNLVCSYL